MRCELTGPVSATHVRERVKTCKVAEQAGCRRKGCCGLPLGAPVVVGRRVACGMPYVIRQRRQSARGCRHAGRPRLDGQRLRPCVCEHMQAFHNKLFLGDVVKKKVCAQLKAHAGRLHTTADACSQGFCVTAQDMRLHGLRTHDRRQHLQAQAHRRADAIRHAHRRQLISPRHQLHHEVLVAALHKVLDRRMQQQSDHTFDRGCLLSRAFRQLCSSRAVTL